MPQGGLNVKDRRRFSTWRYVLILALVAAAAGCSSGNSAGTTTTTAATASSTTGASSAGHVPGVSAKQVNIGAISTLSGQLAGYFGGLAPGMIAYFNNLDAHGGVNGRKIVLTNSLDDGGSDTQFVQDARTLVDQDHVFAIGVASAWFTPSLFVTTKTPTYGYNVSANWQTAPNLFAVGGSTQVYSNGFPTMAYLIKKVDAKSVAFISYGPTIASSYDACSTYAQGLKKAGVNVVLADVGAQLGGSYNADVQKLQETGAQLVVTCMQASDNITLARDIQQYGLKIKQFWLNGYNQALLDQYSSLMQGIYVYNASAVPFEAANKAKYGDTYPGLLTYVAAMNKYEPADTYNGVAFLGWQSAALIAAGIKAVGNNITQANVINATNKITNFTANGVSSPVNWAVNHTGVTLPACSSFVQVQGTVYEPVFAPGKQVFICLGPSDKNPVPVTPPAGTPGT
jgi:ABC-type branched-subunit amino acid transport system substrate-binding protein